MDPLFLLSVAVLGWIGLLALEGWLLTRRRGRIPLRIAVTGTRGKTTVARRLAAILAADGRDVLAKTTGSEAAYVFPDGTVKEIRRLGPPSIIEQKRLLRIGSGLGVDVVIAEVMSVHEENHRVEVQRILQPHLTLVTNFRVDHAEAQGGTREEVAVLHAADVPSGTQAMIPESEWLSSFESAVVGQGGAVERVLSGTSNGGSGLEHPSHGDHPSEFGPNLDLVWGAARALGVDDDTIRRGLANVEDDVGGLRTWQYRRPSDGTEWTLISAFAANDPTSTLLIHDRLVGPETPETSSCVGLLSLRSDRGDRSLLWADALAEGALDRFDVLFLNGLHGPAVRHRLRRHPGAGKLRLLRQTSPHEIMEQVFDSAHGRNGVLFGFGNIGGLGRSMVQHWTHMGVSNGV